MLSCFNAGNKPTYAHRIHGTTQRKRKVKPDRRPPEEVIEDDWKRDFRNAERRKVIKRQTAQKRDSLVDSLLIAKEVIDGHAKNKQFEKKANERRRVIHKCCAAAPGSDQNNRRLSFSDELEVGCSVVKPNWDHKRSLEKSKQKRHSIKEQLAGKRRPSLLEEIGVARDVIVDSERRKWALPPEIAQEVSLCLLLTSFMPNV